jgi:hypothetical protein
MDSAACNTSPNVSDDSVLEHFFDILTLFLSSTILKRQQVSGTGGSVDHRTTNRTTLPMEPVWCHETSTQHL